jgi:hypothetical protein
MRFQKLVSVFLGVLFLLGAGALLANAAQEPQVTEEFSAWAVNMGGAIKSGTVYITIERWSTPEERAQLIAAFQKGAQDELLKVLQKMPKVGFIRLPQTLAYELHYAFQFPTEDGGRNIVIATDRKIARGEVMSGTRSMDYPFELIQMKLDAKGEGEGKLSFATKIYVTEDGKNIALENYGTTPVALNNIKTKIKEVK